MPIHDWTRVRSNRFHHFHQDWTIELARALNRGLLPPGYLALAEQKAGGPEPDVVTLSLAPPGLGAGGGAVGRSVSEAPPAARHRTESDAHSYARKANRVGVHHPDGELVAVIEVVSPGNKDSRHAAAAFARKAVALLDAGVHFLVVDLFPPSRRDPQGVHKLIWDRIRDEDFTLPPGKPLTLAAYAAGASIRAYVEPVAVGDELPDMPLFLTEDRYILCPLEATYRTSWEAFPEPLKGPLLGPGG
jgi:hypothetical protein